uniref:sulfite oxidase n=1 Tax=Trichuris muris TaxID=70415 RepID=A0A5S6R0Q7_TRIMR
MLRYSRNVGSPGILKNLLSDKLCVTFVEITNRCHHTKLASIRQRRWWTLTSWVLSFCGAITVAYGFWRSNEDKNAGVDVDANESRKPSFRADLPTFTRDEVKKHASKTGSIWVTYKDAVYDISDFCVVHPGGPIILQAAGGALEPYFARFTFHISENVFELLEKMRIGNLSENDIVDYKSLDKDTGYLPVLSESLMVKSLRPLNAETSPLSLVESFYTPNSVFYKRNHRKIPVIDAEAYRLKVKNEMNEEMEFSLNELKKLFKEVTIVATLQCAGNRRTGFPDVHGLPWTAGAIGNASWTGIFLFDLLQYVGVRKTGNGHVILTGLDSEGDDDGYQASIPLEKAMDRNAEVLLAYDMNGQPLPKEHGFPLRVVVPGVVAARSVKWLGSISISNQESESPWQRIDYKMDPPIPQRAGIDFSELQAIQELPVMSAICSPTDDQTFPAGTTEVNVQGYAWSGGGRQIIRVEVSSDNASFFCFQFIAVHLDMQSRQAIFFVLLLWVSGKSTFGLSDETSENSKNNSSGTEKGLKSMSRSDQKHEDTVLAGVGRHQTLPPHGPFDAHVGPEDSSVPETFNFPKNASEGETVRLNGSKEGGDFVKSVICTASGMEIELKPALPKPSSGMWDLEVEGHPYCPNASKKDIGAGYRFTISYADRYLCGVEPVAWFTPSWISYAEVTLLLKDDNNTKVADSISCLYNTRIEASSATFRGEVTNEQLRYSGTIDEEGTDIEGFADSTQAVSMEFLDEYNRRLSHQNVKLGDPIKLVINIHNSKLVQQILPEMCYFSSSSTPDVTPRKGHTLIFVRNSCFNSKNPMVRAILPKMDRNQNGSSYELNFPAFHFTNYGRNLYVHCTILACVGNQKQCEPRPGCFGTHRKKRNVNTEEMGYSAVPDAQKEPIRTKEFQLSRYVVVQGGNERKELDAELASLARTDAICLNFSIFVAIAGSMVIVIISLLIVVAWLLGRQGKDKSSKLPTSYAVLEIGRLQILHSDMAAAQAAKSSLEFAKENIGKQYGVLMNGYQKGDWQVTSTIYGPNCTILAPGRPMIKGKEAAQNYWKSLRDELKVTKIEIKCEELNGSGDWFFERGVYNLFNGDAPVEQRMYVKIWRKYEGKMLIHSYIFNIVPAAA